MALLDIECTRTGPSARTLALVLALWQDACSVDQGPPGNQPERAWGLQLSCTVRVRDLHAGHRISSCSRPRSLSPFSCPPRSPFAVLCACPLERGAVGCTWGARDGEGDLADGEGGVR